jgi:oligopeptide/dipeptide ABC transporter ATP-binding protein
LTSQLKVESLALRYETEGGLVSALNNVSLDIPARGYTLGIVGESGSGKTSLAMTILRMIESPGKITGGKIEYEGKDVLAMTENELRDYRWKEIAMVYQSAMNSLNPVRQITDPIIEVLTTHDGMNKADAYATAIKLLQSVGIKEKFAHFYPFELSGGMKQRVVIALALALSPKILIADEPTSALDVVTQRQILELLLGIIVERKMSLVFITHEIALLNGIVDHVAVMNHGEVVEIGPIAKVLSEPLHPYTQVLVGTLAAMETGSSSDPFSGRRKTGVVPGSQACRYSADCRYAFDKCTREAPILREVQKDRWVSCHKY